MDAAVPKSILAALEERRRVSGLRTLCVNSGGVDLCSNDYLGLARELAGTGAPPSGAAGGATGSRLVSGNTEAHETLEQFRSEEHTSELQSH